MNTRSKTIGLFLCIVGWMIAGHNALSEVVYNNSSNRASPALFSQTTTYRFGDEINIYNTNAYGFAWITNFVFEYFGTGFSGNEEARLRIYAQDGFVYGTNAGVPFYAPGTVLLDSGWFGISEPVSGAATLAFNGINLNPSKGLLVPTNFTWTVEFAGIEAGENAGLTLFTGPTVGSSYSDYWENSGGPYDWVLRTTNAGSPNPINFGAFIEAKPDDKAPTCSFVTPVDKFRSYSNSVDVTGKAADAQTRVVLVLYSVGHTLYGTNAFAPVGGTITPTWALPGVPLEPGTNYVHVKAVDANGNESKLAVRKISYVVTNQLTVITNGTGGTIKDSLAGQWLEINRDYFMTAVNPANRYYIFSNWLSSVDAGPTMVATNAAKITFRMQTNLVLTADFVTNRFTAMQGLYYGLFFDETTPIVSFERAGLFQMKIATNNQKFSGKLYIDGNAVGFSGVMDLAGYGVSAKPVLRKGKASLQVEVQLSFDGSDTVTGTVTALSNASNPYVLYPDAFTSTITGYRTIYDKTFGPTNLLGTYTLVVDVPTAPESPKGNGYNLVTVKYDGKVAAGGLMGDYAAFKPVVVQVSKNGEWPLYATAYKGQLPYWDPKALLWKYSKENNGMIIGWMKFTNNIDDDPATRELLDSSVHWIKTPNPTPYYYTNGFTNHDLAVHASAYFMPTNIKTTRVLDITNGEMAFFDGDLFAPFTNTFEMWTNSKIIIQPPNINTQTMTIVPKTGQVKGKFYHPADPSNPIRVPYGAVLQDENLARGVFRGTNSTGSFLLHSTD